MSDVVETTVDEVVETTELETGTAANAPAPELNLSDLAMLRNIIEVSSQRGAFKAAELETVGKSFNKLNAFLESVATQA